MHAKSRFPSERADNAEVEVVRVQGKVSMLAGAGGNITVQTGDDGILMVDAGSAAISAKVMEAQKRLSRGQLNYIVNTDARSDHIGGNELFATTGSPLAIGRAAQENAMIIAFSTILDRMSTPTEQFSAVPEKAWPTGTYSGPLKTLSFNGDGVEIHHMPGTTDGNSIVLFRHVREVLPPRRDGGSTTDTEPSEALRVSSME